MAGKRISIMPLHLSSSRAIIHYATTEHGYMRLQSRHGFSVPEGCSFECDSMLQYCNCIHHSHRFEDSTQSTQQRIFDCLSRDFQPYRTKQKAMDSRKLERTKIRFLVSIPGLDPLFRILNARNFHLKITDL